jgi:ankyrin repeat protein
MMIQLQTYLTEWNISMQQINGTKQNDYVKDGTTPLHYVMEEGDLDLVKCLIETGADLEAVNEDTYTPLHLAADFGRFDIVKCLIENKNCIQWIMYQCF